MTTRIALSVLFALGALGAASCSSSVEQSSVTSGGNTGGGGGNAGGGDSSVGGGNAGGGGGGGSPAVCSDVSGDDYGPCEAELGWGFDGASCKLFSGCDCAPNCGGFFPDAASCALGCAAAGQCDTAAMKGLYLAGDSFEPGNHCDGVYICTPDSSYWDVDALYPGISCEVGICEGSTKHCAAAYNGMVTEEQWETLCAASLLPGIDTIYCVIYGP